VINLTGRAYYRIWQITGGPWGIGSWVLSVTRADGTTEPLRWLRTKAEAVRVARMYSARGLIGIVEGK